MTWSRSYPRLARPLLHQILFFLPLSSMRKNSSDNSPISFGHQSFPFCWIISINIKHRTCCKFSQLKTKLKSSLKFISPLSFSCHHISMPWWKNLRRAVCSHAQLRLRPFSPKSSSVRFATNVTLGLFLSRTPVAFVLSNAIIHSHSSPSWPSQRLTQLMLSYLFETLASRITHSWFFPFSQIAPSLSSLLICSNHPNQTPFIFSAFNFRINCVVHFTADRLFWFYLCICKLTLILQACTNWLMEEPQRYALWWREATLGLPGCLPTGNLVTHQLLCVLSVVVCSCHPVGSAVLPFSSVTFCDPSNGDCPCKPGVAGPRCDRCMVGYWGFGDYGCRPCDCAGSCDPLTGDCISRWVRMALCSGTCLSDSFGDLIVIWKTLRAIGGEKMSFAQLFKEFLSCCRVKSFVLARF